MPLFAPSIPPGFEPPAGLIAPEVFEQMQLYMNCIDPEERRIRELRMKKALDDLSKDSIARRKGLRIEEAPVLSSCLNKDKGLVFDFNRANVNVALETGESSSHTEVQRRRTSNESTLAIEMEQGQSGFSAQAVKSGGNRGTTRKASSWTRRGKRTAHASYKPMSENEAESLLKRKADEEVEVSSKMSKTTRGARQPFNRQMLIDVLLKVSSLVDDSGAWNNEKLIELFPPNEVHRIHQMLPGEVDDCYMWAYSIHEDYTVKTGYEMKVRAKASLMGPVSQEDQRLRNTLTPEVSAWILLVNCGTETINHVLFQCPTATRTWSNVGIALPIASLPRSLEDKLSFAFDIMEDKSTPQTLLVRAIPWVLWLIWKNRNSIMYAETQVSQEKLLRDMMEEVEQWYMLNTAAPRDTVERPCLQNCDRWLPPEEGVIKCNIHANWRSTALHSGIASIARDQAGNVSHHARDAITHAPNPMVAEIRYVIWSLTSLSDIGVTKVIIASDYNEVVEAIKAPLQWPRYRDLLQQVMKLKDKFAMVAFEGETITANGIVRDIAKSVLRDGRFQSYLAWGGPSWLHDRLAREKN
uniref:RNase H type-1 domain-containing protein n=1 Tax=Brassica oleracea var. oleracea TaxID=109376 RepID=A0A0D3CTW6_BRAOL